MSCLPFPARRTRRLLFALALAASAPGRAQYSGGAIVQPLPNADDPAEKLAAALRTLGTAPHDLGALIEAGRDALTLGDPNAAVGFFGRASEGAPRDGRVKAGLAAALVQLEKPRDALRYFQDASALGVPDADLAEDRGLAYDLVGDPAHAQADYRTVLAVHPDDDAARRRLALSQGISGDRAGAIATLDPLIRKRDMAAWRAQTFVLAMTGDAKGANDITRVMLPQQQVMLQPFLERLATLSPGDKARAVHFGEMPAAGRSYRDSQLASIGAPPTYAPAPVPVPALPRAPTATVAPPPVTRLAIAPVARVVSSPPAAPAGATPAATAPHAPPPAGHDRYVSADGVPMRRIEHSAQEILSLGMPRYEYVPLEQSARPPVRRPEATAAATPKPLTPPAPAPTVAVASTPVTPPPRVAATFPATAAPREVTSVAETTAAAPAIASPSPSLSGPPAPVAAATPTPPPSNEPSTPAPVAASADLAIPVGANDLGGHFDVPHEIADRRPVPRTVQATARPSAIPAPPPPAPTTLPAGEPDAANPTVATARRAHAAIGTEVAAIDRPVRSGRTRGVVAPSDDESRAKPADASTSPARKEPRERHGRDADKVAAKTDTDADAPVDRKDKRGGRTHPAARGEDQDEPSRKSRSDRDRNRDDEPAKVRSGKHKPDDDKPDKPSAAPKVYVQVAGGANKADMDKAWTGVKAKAPDLMKGRKPSTTPLRATNRLLVGPFKDEDEAQAFVNKMAAKGLSGFTFKSGKGQKVEKVDTAK